MGRVEMFSFSTVGWIEIDWFVDIHKGMVPLNSCWFGYITLYWGIPFLSVMDIWDDVIYTGAYPSFREWSDSFIMLEHLMRDIEIFGSFHVIIISYWGIATLFDVLELR